MSVAIDCLAAAVNCCLGNINLSDSETLKYMAAARSLETAVESVKSLDQLPNAANNTGRIIYVESIQDYRYSDSVEWVLDFGSQQCNQMWSWGSNGGTGKLGDGTTTNRSSPVSVIGGFSDWCAVAAGCYHSAAIRTNGTAWAWGQNTAGQLGHDTASTCSRSSPVSVIGGFTDWCMIAACGLHNLALRTNGTAWSWGSNNCGQLGDGTVTDRSSPVAVIGGFSDWCQVSAGRRHSAAIRTNGTAWAWGCNFAGGLGDGTTQICRSSPVAVVGSIANWSQISAGESHNLALRADGTAWSWGSNGQGLLGDGTVTARCSPGSVIGGFTDWCAIDAGSGHSVAIRTNGTMWSWGFNGGGRLGDGTVTNQSSPVAVAGGITDWCVISAGNNHNLALRTNGTARAWGFNNVSQLGDGTITDRSSPVAVVGGFSDWCAIAAGNSHSVAIRSVRGF